MQERVLVGFNGSVESILSCILLKAQGFQVYALYIDLWQNPDKQKKIAGKTPKHSFVSRCSKQKDSAELKALCEKHELNFVEEDQSHLFLNEVIDPFIHSMLQSKKSLPCIGCNNRVLLKRLFEKADELKCSKVATGHFAQVEYDPLSEQARLLQPVLIELDQTYFLYQFSQEQLKRIIFPLGSLTRTMMNKLLISLKMESETVFEPKEVCFQKSSEYSPFIKERTPESLRPIGQIRSYEGDFMGEHGGVYSYSVGEKANSYFDVEVKENFYIAEFDRSDHTVMVGSEKDLFRKKALLKDLNWVRPHHVIQGVHCKAQITPRGELYPCMINIYENNSADIEFSEPIKPLQIGTPIVFYDKNQLIGGGVIQEIFDYEFPVEVDEEEEVN